MNSETTNGVNEVRLLRINEVAELTTLSKSCIHLWVAQGRFPAPLTLSPTVKVWRQSQLLSWVEIKTQESKAISECLAAKPLEVKQ